MLSTTIAASGNNEVGGTHHFATAVTPTKAKDDTCTQTRVRHPTDRGYSSAATAPLSPTMYGGASKFFENAAEARSRAYSANYVRPVARMNLYKRADTPVLTKDATGIAEKTATWPTATTKNSDSNGSAIDESSGKNSSKRESWLQKGWKAAQSHRQPLSKQTSPIAADHQQQPQIDRRSPVVVANTLSTPKPITGFLDRLRPRSNSDASGLMVGHQALVSRRKKDGSKNSSCTNSTDGSRKSSGIYCDDDEGIGMRFSPAIISLQPQIHESSSDVHSTNNSAGLEVDSLCEEDMFDKRSSPTIRRKRSNSEATNYLIMRKTSRPNGAEVLGSLDRHDAAYKQLLTKFTCYDLMPVQGTVVVVDCQLPTRQALNSLSENGVRAALLWDSRHRMSIGFVTVTDLLRIMCAYFANPLPKTPTLTSKSNSSIFDDQAAGKNAAAVAQPANDLADILRQPILSNLIKAGSIKGGKSSKRGIMTTVGSEDTLHSAATALRLNRLHRVAVVDMETGNPVYLLSSKRLLHFLYNHMTNLPLPSTVYKSLDELRLGTWVETSAITSVGLTSPIMEAAEKFLQFGVSSLPVLETCIATTETPKSNGHCSVMEMDPNCTCKLNRLLDSLTKVDLMHFILVNGWSELQEKSVEDVLKARNHNMEKLITCHRKTPLSLAIDRLILSNAHRIYIVDSSGVLEGLLSVGDLLSYLLD